MYPINPTSGIAPALTDRKGIETVKTNGASRMQLLHEALSRARMRRPQARYTTSTEAPRPARRIAMQARQQAARELGL